MGNDAAIRSALELLVLPSRLKAARAESLPEGIDDLLRVVAGDEDVIAALVQSTGRPADTLKQAAAFYIEQVMLYPDADHYRHLGSVPGASSDELRRRMALLMAWLHPDKANSTGRKALAQRVMEAWHHLSNDDRRSSYDALLASAQPNDVGFVEARGRIDPRKYTPPKGSRRGRFLTGLKALMLGQRPPLG